MQLEVARSTAAWHAERFGYDNVTFKKGIIEDLRAAGIADESIDVVTSNCVVRKMGVPHNKACALLKIIFQFAPGAGDGARMH